MLSVHVIEDTEAETLPSFKEPSTPRLTTPGEFEQKLPLVTTMSEMPNLSWNI